jgi:nucleoside-diphosphate-sugar epimerase
MMNQQHPDMQEPASILVTGGGGFLGGAVVRKLVARGDRVRSLSRSAYPELDALGVDQIQADLADADALQTATRDVDTVFHVAAKPGVWGGYTDFYHANVVGTRNVISACKANQVPVLVYTSSPSVVFDGNDMEGVDETVPYPQKYHAHYPRTKARAEQEVIRAGGDSLKVVVLRPHLIWGPGDPHMAPRIIERAKRLRRIGKGQNRVDTIYVDNAADAHILAADALHKRPELSGRIYFISQDDPIPLWDMVDAILAAAGLGPVKGSIPRWVAWSAGALLESAYRVLGLKGEPQMTRFVANELATAHWFDISAAKRDLGYRPAISTAEGLEKLAQWLKNNGRF